MSVPFLATHDSQSKHSDSIWGVEWTTQDQVVSTSGDGKLKVWDLEGKLVNDASPQHPLGIVSLSVPISGKVALANSLDGTTILHSLDGSAPPTTHESFLEHVSNRDGQDFATADDEPSVSRTTWAVSLHPDEKVFAASGAGGKVGIRAATPAGQEGETFGKLLRELDSGREKFGLNVKFSPDGRTVALSSENGQVFIWDIETGSLRNTYSSHNVPVRALTWSPDSQYLYSGSDDKSIVLHDVRSAPSAPGLSGQKSGVSTLNGHSSWVLDLSASMSDSHSLLSGSADKTVKVWDARLGGKGGEKGGCVGTFGEGAEVWGVSWRPLEANQAEIGKRFVSAGDERAVRWWRAAGTEQ